MSFGDRYLEAFLAPGIRGLYILFIRAGFDLGLIRLSFQCFVKQMVFIKHRISKKAVL